mgnify:CR=1 FL=1
MNLWRSFAVLKIKRKRHEVPHKKKIAAYKEIQKDDNLVGLYAKVPSELHYKLKKKLLEQKTTYAEWLVEEIKKM